MLTAEKVKQKGKELGADLVGICSAQTINKNPPDLKVPQIPANISPEMKSLVAIVKRIPAGAFRAKSMACVHHLDQLVLREHDKIAYRIARYLEQEGSYAFQTAAQETSWEMKHGSYGYLSTRHVAIEAGLGTLGLELNLMTREFGPRCYTTCILTTAELEPDAKMTEQVCIGETCSRCLYACPSSAVLHWGIDKRACATVAQEFGVASLFKVFERFITAETTDDRMKAVRNLKWFGIWQGLLRVVGAFGDCPRCLAVCPVGDDYQYLSEVQREIPEKTPEKVAAGKGWARTRKASEEIVGMSGHRLRWIGEDGYKPPKKRKVER